MDETIATFGFNAGKIWRSLNTDKALKEDSLLQKTQLNPDDFVAAVGWLAREDKICRLDNSYQLGETNLMTKIGKDAGKVWKVLHIWDDVDVSFIARQARIDKEDVIAALGWLGREDKLQTTMVNPNNRQIIFRLK